MTNDRTVGRQSPRANIHQFVRMVDENDKLVGIGFVVNVSAGGAKIETQAQDTIPEVFKMLLSVDGTVKRQCAVVWRGQNSLGVRFIGPKV